MEVTIRTKELFNVVLPGLSQRNATPTNTVVLILLVHAAEFNEMVAWKFSPTIKETESRPRTLDFPLRRENDS